MIIKYRYKVMPRRNKRSSLTTTRRTTSTSACTFSQFTLSKWTLENVNAQVLPTFADLYMSLHFDTASLSLDADVPVAIVDQMLCDYPVPMSDARFVLQTLSSQTGRSYTLKNVVVKLSDREVQHD